MNKYIVNLGLISYTVTWLFGINYIVHKMNKPIKSNQDLNHYFNKYWFLPRI